MSFSLHHCLKQNFEAEILWEGQTCGNQRRPDLNFKESMAAANIRPCIVLVTDDPRTLKTHSFILHIVLRSGNREHCFQLLVFQENQILWGRFIFQKTFGMIFLPIAVHRNFSITKSHCISNPWTVFLTPSLEGTLERIPPHLLQSDNGTQLGQLDAVFWCQHFQNDN